MAIEYPDIMGDYIDARQRFDAGGLHYIHTLEPATIAPGDQTQILFLVQSALDVPLELAIKIELPTRAGRLGRAVSFQVAQTELQINIGGGEVGVLRIPLTCAPDTPSGTYEFKIMLKTKASSPGSSVVRAASSHGRLGTSLILDPVGLGIAPIIGVGYEAKNETRQTFRLEISGASKTEPADLSPGFDTLWTPEEMQTQHAAQREVSDRRPHILSKLTPEALYATLWQESLTLFEGAGLPLRVGEAVFMARILTYTAVTFLNKGDWYDALLVPIWMEANRNGFPTGDAVWVVTQVGYEHLLRLSAAMSFGLIVQAMGHRIWSNEEQREVIDLLSNTVCKGQGQLPQEFLYLPLLLGGLAVAREFKMPEEDLSQSVQLLAQAYQDRAHVFDGELAVVNDLFEQLSAEARR